MQLVHLVTQWYFVCKRSLPWRETTDPYAIWVSEIILQQTRVAQGLEYYYRFLERFPSVFALADASEEEVLKIWQGLGYYSRARNMHAAAKDIVFHRSGAFPATYAHLLSLKGVGPYTAAAVASFAFQEAVPAVDGNVHRVISRLFGISDPVGSSAFNKQMSALACEMMDKDRPDISNQAWMELGALVCTPARPDCPKCPLMDRCLAFESGMQGFFPVMAKKAAVQSRFFHYLVISFRGDVFIRRRPSGDIWQGLYEFPLIEAPAHLSLSEILNREDVRLWIGEPEPLVLDREAKYRHRLSHQLLHVVFFEISLFSEPVLPSDFIRVSWDQIGEFAVSGLIDGYLLHRNM